MVQTRVVLDTNVLVAAGFRPRSAAGRIVAAVSRSELTLVWDEPTRSETRHILRKIPPLDWQRFTDLYQDENRFEQPTDPATFGAVTDPADRYFAALAHAADAVLISQDDHLLSVRDRIDVQVSTASHFAQALGL